MASFFRLVRLKSYFNHRQFSALAKPDSETLLANQQKIRTVLSLLEIKNKTISSAEQILYLALSDAVSTLPHMGSSTYCIPSFLHELKTQPSLLCSLLDELKARPDLRKERFFTYFITLYGQADMFDGAIQTFKEMAATLKIAPSTESLNVLLRAGLMKSTISKVMQIFNEIPSTYGITPDVETYNILLEGFVPLGYYYHRETICSILEQMETEQCIPDDTTSNIFMYGLLKEKHEDSVQVVIDMVDRDILLLDARVYNFGIESLCKLKKTGEALDLFEKVLSQDVKPNADNYKHLIHMCCEQGNLDEFIKLHRRLRNNILDAETDRSCCETLIETLWGNGHYQTAYTALKECISEKWFAEAFLSDTTTINSLMYRLLRTSNHCGKQVYELYKLLEKNNLQADLKLYNCSIECLSETGRTVEAKAVFEGLEAKGLKPDAITYGLMMDAFSKEGDFAEVRRLYFDMSKKDIKPTESCYENLIMSLTQGGYYDTALEACESCMSENWFLDLDVLFPLDVFLNALDKISGHDDVLKLLEIAVLNQLGKYPEITICNSGVRVLCDRKETAEANALCEAMALRGIKPNAETYELLISGFADEGNLEEVMRLYNVMRGKAIEPCRYSYETIVKFLVGCGDSESENALQVCKQCLAEEWFEDFFFSMDLSMMKSLFRLVIRIARVQD